MNIFMEELENNWRKFMSFCQSEFEEKLKIAKNNYLKNLYEKYTLLISLKDIVFKAETLNKAAYDQVFLCVHKLSGSSAMFGYAELGKTSFNVELMLKEFIENDCSLHKQNISHDFEILLNEIQEVLYINKFIADKTA